MATNSHSLRVAPPPVSDDVKKMAASEAETSAAGVHSSGQEPGMQSRSTPQGPDKPPIQKRENGTGDEEGVKEDRGGEGK